MHSITHWIHGVGKTLIHFLFHAIADDELENILSDKQVFESKNIL